MAADVSRLLSGLAIWLARASTVFCDPMQKVSLCPRAASHSAVGMLVFGLGSTRLVVLDGGGEKTHEAVGEDTVDGDVDFTGCCYCIHSSPIYMTWRLPLFTVVRSFQFVFFIEADGPSSALS